MAESHCLQTLLSANPPLQLHPLDFNSPSTTSTQPNSQGKALKQAENPQAKLSSYEDSTYKQNEAQ